MKMAIAFAALTGLMVPAVTASAASATVSTPSPATGLSLVARWNFDAGMVDGKVADSSGRGPALTVRSANGGALRFMGGPTGGKYVAFPDACAATNKTCPSALLEAASNADLNPGTRFFRWSARVHVAKTQISGSANIMQKGVANSGTQWKMQIGKTQGRAQCVVVGDGKVYIARSASPVTDGQWHKLLCQRSGATLSVFVDDVQKGQATIPSTLAITNPLPLRVGGPNFKTQSDMYHGLLDDVYAELG
jgi:hypothetical protein